jgi:Ca2+-binding EF-hand superfamily protein
MKQYDTNNSGVLERHELKSLMLDTSRAHGYQNISIDDADVNGLMELSDCSRDDVIDKAEVLNALEMWQKHMKVLPQIEPFFVKYDKDKSGWLDFAELKLLLIDLNDGVEVDDEDVNWVLTKADQVGGKLGDGKISKFWEMKKVIALWYAHEKKAAEERAEEERARQQMVSACCVLH